VKRRVLFGRRHFLIPFFVNPNSVRISLSKTESQGFQNTGSLTGIVQQGGNPQGPRVALIYNSFLQSFAKPL
jgi:hypothetical protein